MGKRNFKIFTHWLAEIHDIALAHNCINADGTKMDKSDVKYNIDRNSVETYFDDGMPPQEAFEFLMECWADNQD